MKRRFSQNNKVLDAGFPPSSLLGSVLSFWFSEKKKKKRVHVGFCQDRLSGGGGFRFRFLLLVSGRMELRRVSLDLHGLWVSYVEVLVSPWLRPVLGVLGH